MLPRLINGASLLQLENLDQAHLVLASGKLIQKTWIFLNESLFNIPKLDYMRNRDISILYFPVLAAPQQSPRKLADKEYQQVLSCR